MKIYKEVTASDFEFWAGAQDTVSYLTLNEIDQIFDLIENDMLLGSEVSETDINDLFWFEPDFIAELLGYGSFEELMEERKDW